MRFFSIPLKHNMGNTVDVFCDAFFDKLRYAPAFISGFLKIVVFHYCVGGGPENDTHAFNGPNLFFEIAGFHYGCSLI